MSGRWQIRNPGLRPLAAEAAALARRFETVRFQWIPREENRRADALANAAMDGRELPDTDLLPGPAPGPLPAAPSWSPPPSGPATRVVLVRHGETELTAQRRYSGRGDVPLSAAGRAQAQATGARLSTVVGDAVAVVSSPLSRCTATAEAIAAALGGVPVRVEPDLIECDFGEWEGLTFAEVRERWPDRLDAWLNSPGVSPPGGESLDTVTIRVRAALSRLLETYGGEPVVVVSHVTPIKLILRDALAGGDSFLRRLFLDPAGISIVDVFTDAGVAVRTVNETAHLSS
jgi:probable phosphoglycerate mutase